MHALTNPSYFDKPFIPRQTLYILTNPTSFYRFSLNHFGFQNEPILQSLRDDLDNGRGRLVDTLEEATQRVLTEGK